MPCGSPHQTLGQVLSQQGTMKVLVQSTGKEHDIMSATGPQFGESLNHVEA